MLLDEDLQRLGGAGLVLSTGLTAVPADSGVITENCVLGHQGSIGKRGGYRRWRQGFSMSSPIMLFAQYDQQPLIIAGDVDDAS